MSCLGRDKRLIQARMLKQTDEIIPGQNGIHHPKLQDSFSLNHPIKPFGTERASRYRLGSYVKHR